MGSNRFVFRALMVAVVVSLEACIGIPQWNEPVFKSQATTPIWLAGLWMAKEGDGVMRFTARDTDFEVLSMGKDVVCLGSAFVTTHNGDFFISELPGDVKCLLSGLPVRSYRPRHLGEAPLAGYLVFYLDRVNDDEIRITKIDYDRLFEGLEASKEQLGTDLCRKVSLSIQALQRQRRGCEQPASPDSEPVSPEPTRLPGADVSETHEQEPQPRCQDVSVEAFCDLLDTRAVMRSGGGSVLDRSSTNTEYYRVKTGGPSGGESSSTSP
jgi:hypothetical protein